MLIHVDAVIRVRKRARPLSEFPVCVAAMRAAEAAFSLGDRDLDLVQVMVIKVPRRRFQSYS
jgi:2-methylcitrate dehydratase PrpD